MNLGAKRLVADILLILVVAVWGATFVTVKNAIETLAPFTFLAIRFSLAFLFLVPFALPKRKQLRERPAPPPSSGSNSSYLAAFWPGLGIGLVLFAGYAFQTLGLQYTSASNAGFITGLSVVLVPLFGALYYRRNPSLYTWLSVLLAGTGMSLLTLQEGLKLNPGDLLVLFCAISFALHILIMGRFAPQLDPLPLAAYQILGVALACWVFALALEPFPFQINGKVWVALLITAIPATALAFLIQSWAQKFTSPTRLAVIYAAEPVFAALFAYLLAGEVFTRQGLWGSALVLAAMLLAELKGD